MPEPVKLGEIRARHEKLVADMLAFSVRVLYQPDGQQAHADRAALLSVLTATRRALEALVKDMVYLGLHTDESDCSACQLRVQAVAALALATDAP